MKSKNNSEACLLLDLSFPCRLTTLTTSVKMKLQINKRAIISRSFVYNVFCVVLLFEVRVTIYILHRNSTTCKVLSAKIFC